MSDTRGSPADRQDAAATLTPSIATAPIQWGPTPEPDKFNGRGELPLGTLKPGDYVVRVVVGVDGQGEGRVIQTLRKR